MTILFLGVLLWSVAHLFKRVMPEAREKAIARLGGNGYRGVFSLLIVLSIVLMVIGWKSVTPTVVDTLPGVSRHLAMLVIAVGFLFFGCAKGVNFISTRVRHPMLTGMTLWATGHLMANNDNRSLVLFGTLAIWSIVEILVISKAEGAWKKPQPAAVPSLIRPGLISVVIIAVIAIFLHPYLSGVALR